MDRHHRDLLAAIGAGLLSLLLLLGWGIYSRTHQEPPMVVAGAVSGAPFTPPRAAKERPAAPDAPRSASDAALRPAQTPATLRIHVVGAVRNAAVYILPADARVIDAVQKAGGATPDADLERINLADFLKDGEQVRIPRKSERQVAPPAAAALQPSPASPVPTRQSSRSSPGEAVFPSTSAYHRSGRYPLDDSSKTASSGSSARAAGARASGRGHPAPAKEDATPVNLNTATEDQLRTVKGIGPVTAAAILAYRQEHGSFQRIEDIMEVRGIGPKKFEKMKDRLVVK